MIVLCRVHAVNIRNSVKNLHAHVQGDLDSAGLENIKASDIIDIMDGHKGDGYGISTQEELGNNTAKPVYTVSRYLTEYPRIICFKH